MNTMSIPFFFYIHHTAPIDRTFFMVIKQQQGKALSHLVVNALLR